MSTPLNVRARASTRTCTYCREGLDFGGLPTVECNGCGVVLHLECREEAFQCPSIGCPGLWADRIAAGGTDAARRFGVPDEIDPRHVLRRLGLAGVALAVFAGVLILGIREEMRLKDAANARSEMDDVDWLIRKLNSRHPAERAAARVGLISLEPEALSRLVNPLAQTRGWARKEAVRILRSKMTTRRALNDLIAELNTTNRRTIDLVIEVLCTRPLPPLRAIEVTDLVQALDGSPDRAIEVLRAQRVSERTITNGLNEALVSGRTREAIQAFAREQAD